MDRFTETVYTPLERLKRQAQGFLGKRIPLPKNIRDALIRSARDIRDITNISSTPASTKNALKYKASRQRLTKAELIGAVEVKPAPIPRPVYPVPPPP